MRSLLLVEDEEDARELLARGLLRVGYATVAVGDAAAARQALEANVFDAAVVDVVLGDDQHGGLDLLPDLTALAGRPPIIVITAFADVAKVKTALNRGAAYLLEKPFSVPELRSVLDRVLADADSSRHFVDRALSRAKLTDKELAIARLLLKGLPSSEIARLENNSEKTIRQHLTQIYAKCGVASRAELFSWVFPS